MSQSMGQIIKKLRKERNLTQEELAEQLNVTSQAVSKWESEAGMPDISQIVPLSSVFGVSIDILFGNNVDSDDDEAMKIIDKAQKQIYDENGNSSAESIYAGYLTLQEGLKRYPNNMILLINSLEKGLALAYPDNDCYDREHAKSIYEESIRQANVVISYSKNTTDVLRAHMIMVLLHCNYGNIDMAWEHADKFPWRADMTIHEMSAYIAHSQKDYKGEALHCQRDIMYHFEAILDNIAQLGCCYKQQKRYNEALTMFKSVFTFIELLFAGEEIIPPLHCRECGDVYSLTAQTYLETGDIENTFLWLEKMADYDLNIRIKFKNDMMVKTPFLCDIGYTFYWTFYDAKQKLKEKLDSGVFDSIRSCKRFCDLKSLTD